MLKSTKKQENDIQKENDKLSKIAGIYHPIYKNVENLPEVIIERGLSYIVAAFQGKLQECRDCRVYVENELEVNNLLKQNPVYKSTSKR